MASLDTVPESDTSGRHRFRTDGVYVQLGSTPYENEYLPTPQTSFKNLRFLNQPNFGLGFCVQ
jgi:hypothetical protein